MRALAWRYSDTWEEGKRRRAWLVISACGVWRSPHNSSSPLGKMEEAGQSYRTGRQAKLLQVPFQVSSRELQRVKKISVRISLWDKNGRKKEKKTDLVGSLNPVKATYKHNSSHIPSPSQFFKALSLTRAWIWSWVEEAMIWGQQTWVWILAFPLTVLITLQVIQCLDNRVLLQFQCLDNRVLLRTDWGHVGKVPKTWYALEKW